MTNILIIAGILLAYVVFKQMTGPKVEHIDGEQLDGYLKDQTVKRQFVDVRTPSEFSSRKIKGFKNLPLQSLQQSAGELDQEIPVVLLCASGARSMQAAALLNKMGFKNIINVKGGISLYKG